MTASPAQIKRPALLGLLAALAAAATAAACWSLISLAAAMPDYGAKSAVAVEKTQAQAESG